MAIPLHSLDTDVSISLSPFSFPATTSLPLSLGQLPLSLPLAASSLSCRISQLAQQGKHLHHDLPHINLHLQRQQPWTAKQQPGTRNVSSSTSDTCSGHHSPPFPTPPRQEEPPQPPLPNDINRYFIRHTPNFALLLFIVSVHMHVVSELIHSLPHCHYMNSGQVGSGFVPGLTPCLKQASILYGLEA